MSDFTAALRKRLLDDPAVGAIVGREVRWSMVPPGIEPPYIRLQVISDARPLLLEDYEEARTTRVQCDCFASTYAGARGLADTVIAAVEAPTTIAGIAFGRTAAEGPRDLGEDTSAGFIYRASMDLLVDHHRV